MSAASVAQLLDNYRRALGAAKAAALLVAVIAEAAADDRDRLELPALLPALPEIVLAVGAMVLLMFGAYPRRAAPTAVINGFGDRAADRRRR